MAGAHLIPGIAEFSGRWEGRTIDDVFPLGQFLGGSEHSLVFLTTFETHRAAIKLLRAEPDSADAQLRRWTAASRLSHLNLIRIFASGRCLLDSVDLLYVVMECAEEDLSQVLPQRSLTVDEAREMLDPALIALDYLHRQGFVHAHLKPSNIMAVDDRLKLSTDQLYRTGESSSESKPGPFNPPERMLSPAADVWSLGAILEKVLGAPSRDLPEPFAGIAAHCLRQNPAERWTVPQIMDRLSHPEDAPPPPRRKRFPVPVGVMILVGLVIVVVAGVMFKRSEAPAPLPAAPPVIAQEKAVEPAPPPAQEPVKKGRKTKASQASAAPIASTTSVVASSDQPLPDILPQARNSIRGKVIVNVKVEVDPSGAVTSAALASPGSSRYFSAQSLKAVRQWKFQPAGTNQKWQVRFEFLPSGTKVAPQRISP